MQYIFPSDLNYEWEGNLKIEEFVNEVSKLRSIARLPRQSCESRKTKFSANQQSSGGNLL